MYALHYNVDSKTRQSYKIELNDSNISPKKAKEIDIYALTFYHSLS